MGRSQQHLVEEGHTPSAGRTENIRPHRNTGRPYCTVRPTFSGTNTVGSTQTCNPGTWLGAPTITHAYQWLRNDAPIGSATTVTYVQSGSDTGKRIECEVRSTNKHGTTVQRTASRVGG